jgi:hypothetical protein
MAIKGKKKPRSRSPRVVTAGPRPTYVPPKVPLFQRTGAKFLVALVLEAIFFALLVGFGQQSGINRQRENVDEFSKLIDAALTSEGAAIGLTPGSATILPEFQAKLVEVTGEPETRPSREDLEASTQPWRDALTRIADRIAEIDVVEEGLEPSQILALTEARTEIERSLRMHLHLTEQLELAPELSETDLAVLAGTITDLASASNTIFNAGYGKIQDVRVRLDLSVFPSSPTGGIPQPGLPTEIPGAGEAPSIEIPAEEPADGGGGGGGGNGGGGNGGGGNG